MTNALTIRPAQDADAPGLATLLNEIIARGGTTAWEERFTPEHLAEAMLSGRDVICCFVAEDQGGALAGVQSLTRAAYLPRDIGDIGTFARLGRTQTGTGSRLFAATRSLAAERGLSAINATIRADNAGGLAFYGRLGFTDHAVHRAVPLRDGRPIDRISKRFAL